MNSRRHLPPIGPALTAAIRRKTAELPDLEIRGRAAVDTVQKSKRANFLVVTQAIVYLCGQKPRTVGSLARRLRRAERTIEGYLGLMLDRRLLHRIDNGLTPPRYVATRFAWSRLRLHSTSPFMV